MQVLLDYDLDGFDCSAAIQIGHIKSACRCAACSCHKAQNSSYPLVRCASVATGSQDPPRYMRYVLVFVSGSARQSDTRGIFVMQTSCRLNSRRWGGEELPFRDVVLSSSLAVSSQSDRHACAKLLPCTHSGSICKPSAAERILPRKLTICPGCRRSFG